MTHRHISAFGHRMRLSADRSALRASRWMPSDDFADCDCGSHPILDQAEKEIDEYLSGKRTEFSLAIHPEGTDFQMTVWDELRRIPYGETVTYAELARRIGRPKACRAVANACGANPLPVIIPCHRVVASGGRPGGYTGPHGIKQTLLTLEQQTKQGIKAFCLYRK